MVLSLYDILISRPGSDLQLPRQQVRRGEPLITQGSASDELYFVIAGRFSVERNGRELGYVGAGSMIGEIAFFTGMQRTADVTAFRDSLVCRLDRESYETLCARLPELRDAVAAELATRLSATNRFATGDVDACPRPSTIAMLAVGGSFPDANLPERLAAQIGTYRDHRLVTRADLRRERGAIGPEGEEALAWFCACEQKVAVTLYASEAGDAAWNRAIIGQADQILLVAEAGRPPSLSPEEAAAFRQIPQAQRRLLLIHPGQRVTVTGTADWLSGRPVFLHHHAAAGSETDLDRLARFLTGAATGMVCSGGGAFGPAHIGVHTALRAAGARFDIYGGASAGSAMSAAFALGLDAAEIGRRIEDVFVAHSAMRRATLPVYALLDHRRLDEKLAEHFGETPIEDLWLPYFAVATNLATNRLEEIRTGPLWQAIRASSAIPGVLPPFLRADGAILVDGGMIDNLPLATMRRLKQGPNAISSLERWKERKAEMAYAQLPGRWELLRDLLPGAEARPWAPGITETLVRSMMASQFSREMKLTESDLLLCPPMPPGLDLLSWRSYRDVSAAARHYTESAIADPDPAWSHLLPNRKRRGG